jgi:hypothetical protein
VDEVGAGEQLVERREGDREVRVQVKARTTSRTTGVAAPRGPTSRPRGGTGRTRRPTTGRTGTCPGS